MTELAESGQALWDAVTEQFNLTAAHRALLMNACRIADRLDVLQDAIEDEALIMWTEKGKSANPLLAEHRQQMSALASILKQLGVDKLNPKSQKKKTLQEKMSEARTLRAVP